MLLELDKITQSMVAKRPHKSGKRSYIYVRKSFNQFASDAV